MTEWLSLSLTVAKNLWTAYLIVYYGSLLILPLISWVTLFQSFHLIKLHIWPIVSSHLNSVQFNCVQLFLTPWIAACQASLSIINFWSLLKLMCIKLLMPSNHLILCHPLLLPSIFPSIRVFFSESVLHIRWSKYWSFSFIISPPNEYSGLISFRIDWFVLFAVQGTLKSLLQHHSSKASILQHSAFFMVQLSHPYMTTGKTIALTIRINTNPYQTLLEKTRSL